MSALGQKPTCALQKAMSALHPMRPRKRTWNFRTGNFVGRYCDRSSIRFWGVAGGCDPTCDAARGYRTRGRRQKYWHDLSLAEGELRLLKNLEAAVERGLFSLKTFW